MAERESGAGLSYRCLVTGGAGFIGSHLADALIARGHTVTVLDDLSTGRLANIDHLREHPRFRYTIDSITNEGILDRLMGDCDMVFHLAAAVGVEMIVRDPVHVLESNTLGTRAVLAAARRHMAKVLLASSSEIYGKGNGTPFAEDDDRLLGPTSKARWCYSTSKAMGEYLALAYHRQEGLPAVILRFFNTVGPRQSGRYGMVIPRFVRQALDGDPVTVYGDGAQTRTFCDVEDTVRAVVSLAHEPAAVGGVFNIGSGDEITISELARRVVALVRPEVGDEQDGIVMVPYEEAYAPGFEDLRRRVPDTSRLRSLIGWTPRISLEETLRRVIDDMRKGGETKSEAAANRP